MVTFLVLLGLIAVTGAVDATGAADVSGRYTYKRDADSQAENLNAECGDLAVGTLADIGVEVACFSKDFHICPVDGAVYAIDLNTACVIAHNR
ncbi:MAG: hypothetical protein MK171_12620 [Pirellulales bacterium]|nr:hypothetical protein [Pirellulales bacterium]